MYLFIQMFTVNWLNTGLTDLNFLFLAYTQF